MKKRFSLNNLYKKEGIKMLALKKNVEKKSENISTPANTQEVLAAINTSTKKHSKMLEMLAK